MSETTVRTEIDASPARAWAVLSDLQQYPDWNPFIVRASGPFTEHSVLDMVCIFEESGKEMRTSPTINVIQPEKRVAWSGRSGVLSLNKWEVEISLSPEGEGKCAVTINSKIGGLMPVIGAPSEDELRKGFENMCEALKKRAEALGAKQVA